jgi:hypothetical protein
MLIIPGIPLHRKHLKSQMEDPGAQRAYVNFFGRKLQNNSTSSHVLPPITWSWYECNFKLAKSIICLVHNRHMSKWHYYGYPHYHWGVQVFEKIHICPLCSWVFNCLTHIQFLIYHQLKGRWLYILDPWGLDPTHLVRRVIGSHKAKPWLSLDKFH